MVKYNHETYQDSIVRDLCELIAVPSVNDDNPKPGMPFGEGVHKGFQWVKEKASELQFKVTEFDGYALQIDIGSGERVIGMLCHVDVVPGGEGWETDPFEAVTKNGLIYGRGTVDDKGPLVCCLYAAKYMQENGLIPADSRLRIIVGGDEEREWKDIAYYCKHAEPPEISFAADGKFPLVFGEKGLIDFDYIWNLKRKTDAPIRLEKLSGGMARNSVPAGADFVLRTKKASMSRKEYPEPGLKWAMISKSIRMKILSPDMWWVSDATRWCLNAGLTPFQERYACLPFWVKNWIALLLLHHMNALSGMIIQENVWVVIAVMKNQER